MKLSIIIVNYNVKFFLEQCLYSVAKAGQGMDMEVIVVDNNSVDGSGEMVKDRFPEILLIENKKNTGFSRANNQGIQQAKGEYLLLLNPDTVVEEDTLIKTITFMDEHPEAGGLGVKMIDGKGNFLPESKRGLPRPETAFYKIFGFSALFPRSRRFGKYHLGFLDKDKINEVEVLSGAFMLLRKTTLEKTGLLDETFFMYGEDIDLSYRIMQAGYKNFYFPNTRIIHYKGESTKKSSINYVLVFYRAMIIFARKHFSEKNARIFSLLINMAVYFRATIAIFMRFFKTVVLPFFDFLLLLTGMYLLKHLYQDYTHIHYAEPLVSIAFITYGIIWIGSIFVSGGYDRPYKLFYVIRGIITGSALILIFYSLLDEQYRFSRALILLGTCWAVAALPGIRLLLHQVFPERFRIGRQFSKRFAIVGNKEETQRISNLLKESNIQPEFTAWVWPESQERSDSDIFIASPNQLNDVIDIFKIEEVIFSSSSIPANEIMNQMILLTKPGVNYKIAPPGSIYIIGSNSINTSGELYVMDVNSISKTANQRNKRLLDITASILIITLFPILAFKMKNPLKLLQNTLRVILGFRSWVGYSHSPDIITLPRIKKGVLSPSDMRHMEPSENSRSKLNLLYARDYNIYKDIQIITGAFPNLDR